VVELSTLEQIADLMVRQAITDAANGIDLATAIDRAYPFRNLPAGQSIWRNALLRHSLVNYAVPA